MPTTPTTEEAELLDRLGMTEEEARAAQVRFHFTSFRLFLETMDREQNLGLFQELCDRAVKIIARNGYEHQKEVNFIKEFGKLVDELERK